MKQGGPLSVLFIDDDTIERMKFNRAVSTLPLEVKITEAKNGEEALQLLETKTNLPDVILLDLNMPRISGIEFLTRLKSDETLRYIPTIVVTTSNNKKDLLTCYTIGIAGYILKPLKYEEYVTVIGKVLAYWDASETIRQ
ncbi:transcriptional regulator [Reichenbachiella sp. 5M10]|uniref:response regulator n=1 Tax=Reichenbachiella sp. 5M10 TaxID=1889772 RepID=UPI000C15F59A|nr:response regulator [Reichenbachiella sp. 5M10]PIB34023.1 transcriptional regulator [Reichenbachiella sp. 5M10]